MRKATILFALILLAGAGTAFAQEAETEYMLEIAPSSEFTDPYTVDIQGGARDVSGPYDLDGDGMMEVLVTDYTGGGRVHVVENTGVDSWAHVYSTPWMDSTTSSENARVVVGGDLDGDENGEIIFISGANFSDTNPNQALFGTGGVTVYEFTGTDNDYGSVPASVYQFPFDEGNLGEVDRFRVEVMEVMDVDGDGTQELLLSNNGSDNAYDNWFVLSVTGNLGGFASWVQEARVSSRDSESFDPVFRGGGSPYAIHPVDFDGDGSYELSMHSWNGLNFTNADVTGADAYTLPGADAENVYIRPGYDLLGVDDVSLMGGTVVDINGDGDEEVFYPRLNSYRSQAVTLINYEAGEDVLQLTYDQVLPDFLEDPTGELNGITNLGITNGDLDGDSRMEVIGAGWEHTGEDVAEGLPPYFLHSAEWTGPMDGTGDPEVRDNYQIFKIATPLEGGDLSFFDIINRDSAGVQETYYENAGGVYFPAKIDFLGDADGDGFMEIAAAFQGVDDSLTTFTETWRESIDSLVWQVAPDGADFVGTGSTERGFAYNPSTEHVIVVSREGDVLAPILDASTGEVVDTLNTDAVTGGTLPLNQIGVTDDGEIFASNLVTDASGSMLKIYYWADEDADPVVAFDGNVDANRYGDALGVSGTGEDAMVYVSGSSNTQIASFAWTTPDTTLGTPTMITVDEGAARSGIASVDGGDALWINGYGAATQKIEVATGAVLETIPEEILPAATAGVTAFSVRGGQFLAVGPDENDEFIVLDVSQKAAARVVGTIPALGTNANSSKLGAVAYDSGSDNLLLLGTNNGLASYNLELGYYRSEASKQVANRRFMRIFSLGGVALDGEEVAGSTLPKEIELSQNYPNPFNPSTRFSFTLPQDARATVTIYDVLGRTVKRLADDRFYLAGVKNEVTWDGTNSAGQPAASGLYVYTVETETHRTSKTMVLVK